MERDMLTMSSQIVKDQIELSLENQMLRRIFFVIFTLSLFLSFSESRAAEIGYAATFCLQEERININTASVEELKRLPGVGQKLAERVIAHRAKHGAFKRPQDIVIVRGFSANRYRQIAHLIRT
jgi:competence ComEA-like helix-hairpin-helix protein